MILIYLKKKDYMFFKKYFVITQNAMTFLSQNVMIGIIFFYMLLIFSFFF